VPAAKPAGSAARSPAPAAEPPHRSKLPTNAAPQPIVKQGAR
jgi:hypothetical protein